MVIRGEKHSLSRRATKVGSRTRLCILMWLAIAPSVPCAAQRSNAHALVRGTMPPGAAAWTLAARDVHRLGHVQLVEVRVPDGASVAIADEGAFSQHFAQLRVGLRVGRVYRLMVIGIPQHEERAVYPSLELVDRLSPPPGLEAVFPLPVEIAPEDLERALAGELVTRVIYLEDPELALPGLQPGAPQPYFDVRSDEDPLDVADRLGRPMAILRIGSVQPATLDDVFLFGSPPVTIDPSALAGSEPDSRQGAVRATSAVRGSPDPGAVRGSPDPAPPAYRDEYLCDGGDSALPVRFGPRGDLRGVDLEDTVAFYGAGDEFTAWTPSNRVCIYAPRFAAVRHVTAVRQEDGRTVPFVTLRPDPVRVQSGRADATELHTRHGTRRLIDVDQPIINRRHEPGAEWVSVTKADELAGEVQLHADFQIIRYGVHATSETASLAQSMQAAVVWTDNAAAQVILDAQEAVVQTTAQQVGTVYQSEAQGTPRLRLIKIASTAAAQPGDLVDFTLRFDNVGDRTIEHVTIIDNLTTRLEYVPESAKSTLPATFAVQDTDGQSVTLRWNVESPLRPGAGGILQFRCQVK